MKRNVWLGLLLAVFCLGSFAVTGCDDNEDPAGLQVEGRIGVYPQPNSVEFPWTLTGPNNYSHEGAGDVVLDDLDPGEYTLTWSEVDGWVLPNPSEVSKPLAAGAFTSFAATYRLSGQAQPNEVQVNPDPNDLNGGDGAPWTLTGPDGFSESGTGDITYLDMTEGEYTIVWGAVDGWDVSSPLSGTETLLLVEDDGIVFNATYSETQSSSLVFVDIPAGEFAMGSARTTPSSLPYEWPSHHVTLTNGFKISTTEVTWAEFERVMGYNDSWFSSRPWTDHPYDSASWLEAVEFCNTLSDIEGLPHAYTIVGDVVTWDEGSPGFRLPTEAEWEYACRAGSVTDFYDGSSLELQASSCYLDPNLEELGWYCNNSVQEPQPVAGLEPNEHGLFDMSGNLWEWVWDINTAYDQIPMFMLPFTPAVGEVPIETGSVTVAPALAGFGNQQVLRLIDAHTLFSIENLGVETDQVSFTCLSFVGVENFRVNGLPEDGFIGSLRDLPADLVPGITISLTETATNHDTFGDGWILDIVLTGDVDEIEVGGRMLWVDTFAVDDADMSQFGLDRTMDFDLNQLNSFFLPDGEDYTAEAVFGCTVVDPIGPAQVSGAQHMLRGGSYGSGARACRSAARSEPSKGRFAGFRVTRNAD